jgi:4-deoxy-L-threo-5-hexosulose-uronate ketol-isomerase
MEIKYAAHPDDVRAYDTQRLRSAFLSTELMVADEIRMVYTHYDRFVYGGIKPVGKKLSLGTYPELKADFFLQRREMGVINVGGKGTITVDGEEHVMEKYDVLYIGRGAEDLVFESHGSDTPALFYLNSCPAHQAFPTVKYSREQANKVELGDQLTINQRTLYQYIHEKGIQSAQLVMGYTELAPGNAWNTFPPHTHDRRMEVYFYFDLPGDQIVVHFMGQPRESRHLAVHNHQAVLSPPWSIHSGAGTHDYCFVWGMAGENKAFTDMDGISLLEFR